MGGAKGTPRVLCPLLRQYIFTEKTDVYAYGMIVFEVLTGDTPWRLNQMQIMMQVCIKKERPTMDVDAPADLVALMRRCWDHEPDARPDFATIKAEQPRDPGAPIRTPASTNTKSNCERRDATAPSLAAAMVGALPAPCQ